MKTKVVCLSMLLRFLLVVAILSVNMSEVAAADPYLGNSDGDGRCTEVDALAALQMAAIMLAALPQMDVDGDGHVSEVDALIVLQWAAAGGQCRGGLAPPSPPGTPGPPPGGPGISALVPEAAAVGEQVAVRGSGFGTQGILTLNSFPVEDAAIISWAEGEILFRIPVGALSGLLQVIVGTAASNTLHLEVTSSFALPGPADMITDRAGIERVKGQIMVAFREGTDQATIDAALASTGGVLVGYDSRLELYQLDLAGADEATVNQTVANLRARPEVELAAPRFGSVDIGQTPPNDTEYPPGSWLPGSQELRNWGLRYMRLPEAWDIAQGSLLVPLTVVDNGFMINHPDLQPNIFFVFPGNVPWTSTGVQDHGSHVAGIAAAAGNNALGISGVNWRVNLSVYDWDAGAGAATWDRVANHMVNAIDRGTRVINLSAGINWYRIKRDVLIRENRRFVIPSDLDGDDLAFVNTVHQTVARALRHAARNNRDVLVSFAAGNDALPATFTGTARTVTQFPNVMVVASIDPTAPGTPGNRSNFSNHGDLVNIAAPGRDIYSTVPRGNSLATLAPAYDFKNGTSMSAPAVAGLAALTWSMNPNLTAAQVKDCILSGAERRGQMVNEIFDAGFGPHNFYAADAFETLRACEGIAGQPSMMPLPPWKQPAVIECIERWLRLQIDDLNRRQPNLAPWWVDQWGNMRNKAVIDARAPDDWISRWEGNRYKRLWFLAGPPQPGVPPLRTYCGGLVDNTPQPVAPPPAPVPGSEPWKDANVITCINTWMQTMQSCADRTWPGVAPHHWTQYGLLVGSNVLDQQPPDGWGDCYEGNKYKWIWLLYDAREACPGVPSVQDTCSGAIGGGVVAVPSPIAGVPSVAHGGPVSASVLFSIDNSGSMRINDRIGAARRSAQSALRALPADAEVAIQFFGVRGCDVGLALDFTLDHAEASRVVDTAVASGSTPLADAIEQAGIYMRQHARGASLDIILLSDGQETCRGSDAPENAARGLNAFAVPGMKCPGLASIALGRAQGAQTGKPPIRLRVIGFDVSDAVEQQLRAVAAAGGGSYYSAGDGAQLTQVFTQAAQQIARPVILKGDSDGDGRCTEIDALVALQMAAGRVPADPARMDVTGDGQVTEIDALTVLQWAAAGGTCGP